MVPKVLEDLAAILQAVEDNLDVDPEQIGEIVDRVREEALDLSAAQVQEAIRIVRSLEDEISERCRVAAHELGRLRESRKAMRGYHHLRPHRTAQRLRRRA